jgi:non-ribosomal peptide synthetase component E (peptide arylation enzyme)
LNREGLTEERFIKNPFLKGRRMYRTGDFARWLPNQLLEYCGRRDNQVKFHGYRVEMDEIRYELNRHPQIRDSVVLVRKDSDGNDIMVAYYVSKQELPTDQLRRFMRESVVEGTIPNFFVRLPKLPLTLNGKISYSALPDLNTLRRITEREYVAASTATEKALAEIWSQVLRIERVGIHDNFFELGGHSLLATQVASRIKQVMGADLPLRAMFEEGTIGAIARIIKKERGAGNTVEAADRAGEPRQRTATVIRAGTTMVYPTIGA